MLPLVQVHQHGYAERGEMSQISYATWIPTGDDLTRHDPVDVTTVRRQYPREQESHLRSLRRRR